jgi:fatty-acyl-CoA synthase
MSLSDCSVISDILGMHGRNSPGVEAAVDGDVRVSYGQMASAVRERAKALLAAGVRHGDRVATLAPPSLEFWLDYLATVSIGAIWQGLNPRYQLPEYRYLLEDARPRVVFVTSPYEDRDYAADLQSVGDRVQTFVVRGEVTGRAVSQVDFLAAGDAVSDAELEAAMALVQPEDIAVIVYTSGTTGQPKGAMLSQRAIVASAVTNVQYFGEGLESTICAAPINHVGALNNVCMSVFAYGGRIIFYHRVDLAALGELSARELPTYLVASPTSFVMMQQGAGGPDLTRLGHIKLLVFGGGKTPQALLDPIVGHIPKMYNVFGQTECCGIGTATAHGASAEVMAETIGQALPGHELRVAREDETECDIGETGEIQLKGPICASGYWNKPEATAELFTSDGFLRTGDQGARRDDGNICYVGRIKEMFKSGGYNIYPVELEQALSQHPDVLEAAVLPVPHPLFQEVGYAFVVPRSGKELSGQALDAFLRPRLANYKIPKHWSLEEALPRLPNSKIDKQALRRRLENFQEA